LGIDVVFHRAEGDHPFYYNQDSIEVSVLDMVGGSGATILGHNHPELVSHALNLLSERVPFHGQRSIRRYAAELASALNESMQSETHRRYVITFANSGSEANELAVKHAHFERQARLEEYDGQLTGLELPPEARHHNEEQIRSSHVFIAIENGFHGKTNTSLAVSHSSSIKVPSLNSAQPTIHLAANSLDDLEDKLSQYETKLFCAREDGVVEVPYTNVLGIICEPILGDGGIIELSDDYLRALRDWAARFEVPLIFDEIQSGIGRTGDFLASTPSGVVGDYYTLSKALSGGIGKVSALAIDATRFVTRFGLVHSSTYNEDDWSCSIALRALDLIRKEDVPRLAREKGREFRTRLEDLMHRYPNLITEIRGRGLMLGIAWSPNVEQLIPADRHAAQYIEGILFRERQVRVGTAISTRLITRLTPSALISTDSMEEFLDACESLCDGLNRRRWRLRAPSRGFCAACPYDRELRESQRCVVPLVPQEEWNSHGQCESQPGHPLQAAPGQPSDRP
jgi:acetylornithine/succinyldiaminopimelate/putrescine aminotransferase